MFRREWRQQILVVTLLTVAVAAAIGSITIVYNTGPADDSEFGSANQLLEVRRLRSAKARRPVSPSPRSRSGRSTSSATARCPSPAASRRWTSGRRIRDGAYGGVLLALRSGSYPTGPGQVAVTDGVAKLLRLEIGSTLALDGHRRTVVGIVENPRKLSDEFALVSPSSASAPDHVTVLVDASGDVDRSSFGPIRTGDRSAFAGVRGHAGNDTAQAANTLAMFSVATVFLLLASLVAAAGFAVVAQRRLRQLGMLAAVGATQKHLRLVLLTNGAVVGAIAAVVGTIVGLALWLVVRADARVRDRPSHRPAQPSVGADRDDRRARGRRRRRPPPGGRGERSPASRHARALGATAAGRGPRATRRIAAAALIAVGIGCLALSNRDRPLLIVAGIVATILGSPAPGPAGDPHLLRAGRASLDRAAVGAA